ncbi:MAG: phosphate ABC transporter permease PstA [Clostridiales bacterium]|nr:phosphate ABC transporter permease PstA [Clostridiales bacterium]
MSASWNILKKLRGKKPLDLVLFLLVHLASVLTIGFMLFIIGYIVAKGTPYLKPSLFALKYTSDNVSLFPSLVNTVTMTLLSLLIAVPFGIFTAIYLVEYAKRSNKIVGVIRVTTETLAGIPSIIYGLFGFLFFVVYLKWGYSLLAGSFTLAIMILPLIMRTSEEALKSVPDSFREGSFGLGAGRLRTLSKILLPYAMPGILSGVILAIGRIVGESAALIFTAGTLARIPTGLVPNKEQFFLFQSARTLSVHMYALSSEGFHVNEAYATALVLLVLVVGINALSFFIAKKFTRA